MSMQLRWARVSVICGLAAAVSAVAAPVLDLDSGSLTSVLYTSPSAAQDLRPRFDQRAVEIDGSLRSATPMGLAIAADSIGGGYSGQRRLADIALDTGSYAPMAIDLALPSRGIPVVIGRTYNSVQRTTSARYNSNGLQGFNWAQTGLPEITLYDADSNAATKGADDAVYLLFGADRSIEFHRLMDGATPTDTFKAKNGAAGVIVVNNAGSSSQETYEYVDQRGNRLEFFGFALSNKDVVGQLWRMRAPKDASTDWIAYGGHSTNVVTSAASSDFGSLKPNTFYDASGRRYSFTYATYGGVDRLTQVVAAEYNGSTWDTVAQIDYGYYDGSSNTDDGLAGDLRMATVTMLGTGTNNYVARTYYRYMVGTGYEHLVRLVVSSEGVRQFGVAGLDAASDATLTSYSSLLVNSYDSNGRITNATLNGDCGCSGGTSGVYGLSYETAGSYSTYIATAAYDDAWAKRTIVDQPDSAYKVHYFDETGAALAVVTADGDPAGGSPPNFWVSSADRDSSGRVTSVASPAAVDSYTHSTGAITLESSQGLITTYSRASGGDLDGLRTATSVKEGSGGTAVQIGSVTLDSRAMTIGNSEVRAPFVLTSTSYPVAGGGGDTSTYTRAFWSSTTTDSRYLAVKSLQADAPAVNTSKNGSGSATATYRYYRYDGTMAFSKDADGTISYSGIDGYGLPVSRIADADTSISAAYFTGDAPSNWSLTSFGTPFHVPSAMGYDAQGRLIETVTYAVGGGTRSARMVYETLSDGTLAVFSFPRYASSMYYGPAKLTISNLAGKPMWSASLGISSGGTATIPGTTRDATWSSAVQHLYDDTGSRLITSKLYVEDYPSTGTDDTTYTYDSMGRIATVTDPTGTISRTTYDAIGRAIERSIGTDDSGTGSDNMTVVEKMEYDNGTAGGNSHLTKIKRDPDGNWATTGDQRITEHKYDFRGRAIVTLNPMAPHTLTKYDNLNRVVASGQYTSNAIAITDDPASTSTARVALSESSYDERGMVYRSKRHEVNPSTGALGANLESNTWYDADGRTIKQHGSQITKTEYDRLGRGVASWIIASVDDSTYADAFGVSGDIVLEETRNGLDADTGATLARAHVLRVAGNSGTGALASTTGLTISPTGIAGRASITAMWYDELDRVVDTVDYGTNHATNNFAAFDRAAATTPPARDPNDNRRTTYSYDNFGRTDTVTDARDVDQKTLYDVAGRAIASIANFVDGTPGPNDQDAKTVTVYTNGQVTATHRYIDSSTYELTTYTYGTTKGTSGGQSAIATNRLLGTTTLDVQFTGQSATDRQQKVAYNALGEVIWSKDPAGNEIISEYDLSGRVTSRVADVVAGGFDNRVLRIEYEYDSRGHLVEARQRDGKTNTDTVLDEVLMQYDGWGMVDQSAMDPDSALGASGRDAFVSTWTYTTNSGTGIPNTLRLAGRAQTGGVSVSYIYDSGIDSNISRPSSLEDQWSTPIAEYAYMGAGTVLGIENPEPDLYAVSSSGLSANIDYLDQLNRPIRNVTYRKNGVHDNGTIDLEIAYINHGDSLIMEDNATGTGTTTTSRVFDMVTLFDDLRRATKRQEGNASSGSITANARNYQDLSRDLLGRTLSDKLDLDADGNGLDGPPDSTAWGEMEDTRTFNQRGELVSRAVKDSTNPSSPRTVNLTYDLNGNLTSDGEKFTYVYNPWGQLVEIKKIGGSDVVARYTYSAMGHRISEQLDTNDSSNSGFGDGVVDAYDPVFFIATDPSGRRLATYRGTDYDPKETFIHHDARIRGPVHQGGPILRDRNADLADKPEYWSSVPADTDRYERHYYALDYRGYVSAIFAGDGTLVEQVRYSATGVPFNIPLGDVNADGKVEAKFSTDADWNQIEYMWKTPAYHVRGDLDLDGDVDAADLAIAQARDGTGTGRGYYLSGTLVVLADEPYWISPDGYLDPREFFPPFAPPNIDQPVLRAIARLACDAVGAGPGTPCYEKCQDLNEAAEDYTDELTSLPDNWWDIARRSKKLSNLWARYLRKLDAFHNCLADSRNAPPQNPAVPQIVLPDNPPQGIEVPLWVTQCADATTSKWSCAECCMRGYAGDVVNPRSSERGFQGTCRDARTLRDDMCLTERSEKERIRCRNRSVEQFNECMNFGYRSYKACMSNCNRLPGPAAPSLVQPPVPQPLFPET